jgi:hypothetical protein
MGSPLGKYGSLIAAVIAMVLISAFVLVNVYRAVALNDPEAARRLEAVAFIAVGAVFGSTATINGVKQPLESAHSRIDRIQEATGIETHGSYPKPSEPTEEPR